MGHKLDSEILGHPSNPTLFAQAPYLGHIRLDDIECSPREPRQETLPASQNLTTGDGDRGMLSEFHKVVQSIWTQRFFKPNHIVLLEHVGRLNSPLVTARPISV